MEFLVFEFLHGASRPVTGHHWRESGSVFFIPPVGYLYTWIWSPWAFSRLRQQVFWKGRKWYLLLKYFFFILLKKKTTEGVGGIFMGFLMLYYKFCSNFSHFSCRHFYGLAFSVLLILMNHELVRRETQTGYGRASFNQASQNVNNLIKGHF